MSIRFSVFESESLPRAVRIVLEGNIFFLIMHNCFINGLVCALFTPNWVYILGFIATNFIYWLWERLFSTIFFFEFLIVACICCYFCCVFHQLFFAKVDILIESCFLLKDTSSDLIACFIDFDATFIKIVLLAECCLKCPIQFLQSFST